MLEGLVLKRLVLDRFVLAKTYGMHKFAQVITAGAFARTPDLDYSMQSHV